MAEKWWQETALPPMTPEHYHRVIKGVVLPRSDGDALVTEVVALIVDRLEHQGVCVDAIHSLLDAAIRPYAEEAIRAAVRVVENV